MYKSLGKGKTYEAGHMIKSSVILMKQKPTLSPKRVGSVFIKLFSFISSE